MSIITKMRKQKAYWWEQTAIDAFGQPVYARPILIDCRWTDEVTVIIDKDGAQRPSSAVVYVDRDMEAGHMLGLEDVLAAEQDEQVFEVALSDGHTSADVVFPTPFATTPFGLYCQIVDPNGAVLPASPVYNTLTKVGVAIEFGSAIPGPGYSLLVKIRDGFAVAVPEGATTIDVLYPLPYTDTPNLVLAQLAIPVGGVVSSLSLSNITKTGFRATFSSPIPASSYWLYVQVVTDPLDYQEFNVDLDQGSESIDVTFPEALLVAPAGIYCKLNSPSDGFSFEVAPVYTSITKTGCTIRFGAAVPGTGYSLTINVRSGFKTDLSDGVDSAVAAFPSVYGSVPEVLAQLAVPEDGYFFSVSADNISASGFTASLGAAVPGPGYKLLAQVVSDTEAELVIPFMDDPRKIEGVYEVIKFVKTPNIRASEFLRACYL